MKRRNIFLDDEIWERAKQEAKKDKRSTSSYIRKKLFEAFEHGKN